MDGRAPEDIVADLLRLDWSLPAARALVAPAQDDLRRLHESPESRQLLLRESKKQFFAGLMLALLGVIFTTFTLLAWLAGALPFILVAFGLFFGGLILWGPRLGAVAALPTNHSAFWAGEGIPGESGRTSCSSRPATRLTVLRASAPCPA